jgi:hypothetical protein
MLASEKTSARSTDLLYCIFHKNDAYPAVQIPPGSTDPVPVLSFETNASVMLLVVCHVAHVHGLDEKDRVR